jgi:hypothetical protein
MVAATPIPAAESSSRPISLAESRRDFARLPRALFGAVVYGILRFSVLHSYSVRTRLQLNLGGAM